MGYFKADAILAGFIALSDAASIGAESQCQQGGVNRFPENFDTPLGKHPTDATVDPPIGFMYNACV